jgi:hypothetical protein
MVNGGLTALSMDLVGRDAALEWLVNNKITEPEQRCDAPAILSGISVWLEQAE